MGFLKFWEKVRGWENEWFSKFKKTEKPSVLEIRRRSSSSASPTSRSCSGLIEFK
jgi:hypothetical protein